MSVLDDIASRFGQWLPNSDFTIPFELVTVYNSVNSVWDAMPVPVRISLTGAFMVAVLFCILRMLL